MSELDLRLRAALEVESLPALPDPGVGRGCNECGVWKTAEHFKPNPEGKNGLHSVCKECTKPKGRAYMTMRHQDEEYRFKVRIEQKYHITREQYDALLASQGFRCPGCGTDDPGKRGWHIDHDHACCPGKGSCGKCVRGLLCLHCNVALGYVKDNVSTLQRLAAYLGSDDK